MFQEAFFMTGSEAGKEGVSSQSAASCTPANRLIK